MKSGEPRQMRACGLAPGPEWAGIVPAEAALATEAPDHAVGDDRADNGYDNADDDLRHPIPHGLPSASARRGKVGAVLGHVGGKIGTGKREQVPIAGYCKAGALRRETAWAPSRTSRHSVSATSRSSP